jgi:outer membrane protein
MIKRVLVSLCIGLSAASSVSADTVLGVTMSIDAWDMDSSGELADSVNLQDFDLGSQTPANFSFALEHPVPLIPNFRLKFAELSSDERNQLSADFDFNGVPYSANESVDVDFNLQSSDFIFYYEFLDNDLVSLDLGLNVKYLDGDIQVKSSSDGDSSSQTFKGVVPMLYGAFQIGVPATRLSFFGDLSLLSVGDHTLRDYQAGVAYTLIENMAIDINLRGGYRSFTLELEDLDDIYADWTFDGLFLGVEADF